MTQEFAKTPILGQPGKIRPRSFPRKNQRKLALFFIFVLSSFLMKKQFPIISSSHYNSRTEQTYCHISLIILLILISYNVSVCIVSFTLSCHRVKISVFFFDSRFPEGSGSPPKKQVNTTTNRKDT